MTLEYLLFANVVLLGRLIVYFRDETPGRRAWTIKSVAEVAVVLAVYQFSWAMGAAAAASVFFNRLAPRAETRAGSRNFNRLALGLIDLAVLSLCFAPAFGVGFRPWFAGIAGDLPRWTTLAAPLVGFGGHQFQLFCFGLLLAANEANLAIRTVFDWLDLKPRKPAADGGLVDTGELNRGRIIGVLERALLYVFILQGQLGAIGFVLAAKAFTRFKALDDRSFAEYVLIGTLLSAALALAVGALVRAL